MQIIYIMLRKDISAQVQHTIFGLRFKTEGTFNILISDVNHRNGVTISFGFNEITFKNSAFV